MSTAINYSFADDTPRFWIYSRVVFCLHGCGGGSRAASHGMRCAT